MVAVVQPIEHESAHACSGAPQLGSPGCAEREVVAILGGRQIVAIAVVVADDADDVLPLVALPHHAARRGAPQLGRAVEGRERDLEFRDRVGGDLEVGEVADADRRAARVIGDREHVVAEVVVRDRRRQVVDDPLRIAAVRDREVGRDGGALVRLAGLRTGAEARERAVDLRAEEELGMVERELVRVPIDIQIGAEPVAAGRRDQRQAEQDSTHYPEHISGTGHRASHRRPTAPPARLRRRGDSHRWPRHRR